MFALIFTLLTACYVSAEENNDVLFAAETGAEENTVDSGGVKVDAVNFPDEGFRQYVSENFDSNSDGYLSAEEISFITDLSISSYNSNDSKDFTGIEYFSSLETINFRFIRVENLNISKNTALKTLKFDNIYALKEIDISKNVNLEYLELLDTDITNIDLSNNPKLKSLRIGWWNGGPTYIESLDVSKNPLLEELDFWSTAEGIEIDLSNNPNLKKLYLNITTKLSNIDLSNNPLLEELKCFLEDDTLKLPNLTNLKELTIHSKTASEIDLSALPALQLFTAYCPNVTEVDFSNNPELTEIVFNDSSLANIDVSACTKLYKLECYNNKLEKLDLTNNNELKYLLCDKNRLQELDLTNKTKLTWLVASDNLISNLDVSDCPENIGVSLDNNQCEIIIDDDRTFNLENLPGKFDTAKASGWSGGTVEGNILTVDDGVSKVTYDYDIGNGEKFNITLNIREESENPIAIDSTNFPDENFRKELLENGIDKNYDSLLSKNEIDDTKELTISSPDIYSLKGIEFFTELTSLSCDTEKVKEIDVSSLTNLTNLSVVSSQLSQIDVSNLTNLENLSVVSDELSEIDVKNNGLLKILKVNSVSLTEIDVSSNTLLTELNVNGCSLREIDISSNENLDTLRCENNLLRNLDLSNNLKLGFLFCGGNKLTVLDISNNNELFTLACESNLLTELNIANKTKLYWLECANNLITELDLSDSRDLAVLICNNNRLETLKIGSKNYFNRIIVNNNRLTNFDISLSKEVYSYMINTDKNIYKIQVDENNSFDLMSLTEGFDVSKASNWVGGTVNGTILTVDEGKEEITYSYDIGNGETAEFTLSLSPICDYTVCDINGDYEINISDVTAIQSYIANLDNNERYKFELADVNSDGNISVTDVTAMQLAIAFGYV